MFILIFGYIVVYCYALWLCKIITKSVFCFSESIISMASSNEAALDLRKLKLAPDLTLAHSATLPSFSFCFSPSRHSPADPSSSSAPIDSPTYFMTQRVRAAAFTRAGKPTRPFKAYPKNPLSLTVKTVATKALDNTSNRAYLEFRRRMLVHISSTACTKTNRPPSPCSMTSGSGGEQDEPRDNSSYWERRRKNNEAAKRSRDARRAKEDEIAIRAAFLEQENLKLKCKVVSLTNELTRLRYLLYSG